MKNDIYLHIQTKRAGKLKGESIAPGHTDDIIVRHWTWGVMAQAAMGQVQATARRSYKNLVVVKYADTASTGLLSALATNDEVKEAKLTMRRSGTGQQDFYKLTLKNARITSVDIDTDEESNVRETITLAFTKVEVEYNPQQVSGAKGASFIFMDEV